MCRPHMLPAITLHHQPRFDADEVCDIRSESHLTPEFGTPQLPVAQMKPQGIFGVSRG